MEQLEMMPTRVRIAAIIRKASKAILSGELRAGEDLSLTEMTLKLGVSRTPIREAFQTLESEGLIELRMNKGAVVKLIDEKFIKDHFNIRMLLEGEAAARSICNKIDPAPLEALQRSILSEKNLVTGNVYENYNQAFHTKIWAASKSTKLYIFCETLWNGPSFSRAVTDEDHRRLSIAKHGEFLICAANGNVEKGRKAIVCHIERSMRNILEGFRIKQLITLTIK